ncbi:MAG: Glyoxalase-like domain [Pseudomonadota bacterium]|jgi:predicted enzyme related to lactoylglutathione lyase
MNLNRRSILWSMAALGAPLPQFAFAQGPVLPLRTPGIDHLDVMVPDPEATTKFYMGLFRTELHAQAFRGAFRYFVLLDPLPENRQVGYLAVGNSTGRGAYIGHFCTSVYDWQRDGEAIMQGMTEEFAEAGFGEFPGSSGFGALFKDPDGIEIQYLPAPDTLVTAAEPSQLVPWHAGLVTPHGVQSVLLRVRDLERALAWYGILYGTHSWTPDMGMAYFEFPESQTRLYLEQAKYEFNQEPGIVLFGIRVEAFDKAAVSDAVVALGGTVLPVPGNAEILRIRDPDGNVVQLHPM